MILKLLQYMLVILSWIVIKYLLILNIKGLSYEHWTILADFEECKSKRNEFNLFVISYLLKLYIKIYTNINVQSKQWTDKCKRTNSPIHTNFCLKKSSYETPKHLYKFSLPLNIFTVVEYFSLPLNIFYQGWIFLTVVEYFFLYFNIFTAVWIFLIAVEYFSLCLNIFHCI